MHITRFFLPGAVQMHKGRAAGEGVTDPCQSGQYRFTTPALFAVPRRPEPGPATPRLPCFVGPAQRFEPVLRLPGVPP
jgi:hypothetical protein